MNETAYRKLVRASGVYDLVMTAAFATPWTFVLLHQSLGSIWTLPPVEPLQMLFANLLGSVVLVWSVLRVRHPLPAYGLYDTVARFLFLSWQLHYLINMGGASFVWFLSFFELAFGIAQGYGYLLLRKTRVEIGL